MFRKFTFTLFLFIIFFLTWRIFLIFVLSSLFGPFCSTHILFFNNINFFLLITLFLVIVFILTRLKVFGVVGLFLGSSISSCSVYLLVMDSYQLGLSLDITSRSIRDNVVFWDIVCDSIEEFLLLSYFRGLFVLLFHLVKNKLFIYFVKNLHSKICGIKIVSFFTSWNVCLPGTLK